MLKKDAFRKTQFSRFHYAAVQRMLALILIVGIIFSSVIQTANAQGFGQSIKWHDWFCIAQEIPAVGDFNGDGKDDVVTFVRDTQSGQGRGDVFVALSDGSKFVGTALKWHDLFCIGDELPVVGDFNGDGKDDIATFTRGSNADVFVALSNGSQFVGTAIKWHDAFCYGQEVPTVGDFNGDGKDDIITFVRDTQSGQGRGDVFVALSDGSKFVGTAIKWHDLFCIGDELPAIGDFNGDGKDDIATFTRGNNADVYIALSNGSQFVGTALKWHDSFCDGQEVPAVGDFNGDGKDDIVTFVRDTQSGQGRGDVFVALSDGSKFLGAGVKWHDWFCTGQEVPAVGRFDSDLNVDIITFVRDTQSGGGQGDVYVSGKHPHPEYGAASIQNISLVKEQSRPEVYFILGGMKFPIWTAIEFDAMGFNWAKVQVVHDGTLNAYPSKPFANPNSNIKPSDVFFDGADNDRRFARMSKDPASIVGKNVMLAGWLDDSNPQERRHPYPNCWVTRPKIGEPHETIAEDFHYDFIPDPDFIEKMYGKNGLSFALNGAVLSGNKPNPNNRMRFDDISEIDGSSRGVTLNSFALPMNLIDDATKRVCLIGELNCWHEKENHNFGTRWWDGRGAPPIGWVSKNYCPQDAQYGAWWPYNPSNPDGGPADLQRGDYVLLKGILWQDNPHGDAPTPTSGPPWDRGATEGYAGYLEVHPIDWIVRVNAPLPGQRKTAILVEVATPPSNLDRVIDTGTINIYPDVDKFYPAFEVSSPQEKKKQTLKVREVVELVDGRFTDISTVWKHFALNMRDHVEVQVGVRHSGTTQRQGRFKGVYIVTWEVPGAGVCSSDPNRDRLDLFVRGTNDEIWYRWFGGGRNSWTGSAWQSLGGVWTSDPSVVVLAPTLIYIFARGMDNALWRKWVNLSPSGGIVGQSDWASLGGVLTSRPAACSTGPDQLDLFVRGTDNAIYYKWFDGKWSEWTSLGGVATSDPAVIAMHGYAWVFVRGADNAVYFRWVRSGEPTNSSDWQRLEGAWTSAPAVCPVDPDREMFDVFARGTDNALWCNRFTSNGWSGWQSLGGVLASAPSAMAMIGASWIVARGTDDALYFMWLRSNSSDHSGWQRLEGTTP